MQHQRFIFFSLLILVISGCGTAKKNAEKQTVFPVLENSLLWKIEGNGISKPSYLFGTIHMICRDDALLSDSLTEALKNCDKVFLEVDMDNIMEMFGALTKMKMRNDTTLADLLNQSDYQKVKDYFEEKGGLLPFSVIEKYKPFLAASTMMENGSDCDQTVAMEQVILEKAKGFKKKIDGLETMAYQMSIFDSIPYKVQAELLVKYIDADASGNSGESEYAKLIKAYKEQDLNTLSALTREGDMGISNFEDLLLNNRNRNWVTKLKTLLTGQSVTIAVGAGHLPGEYGLINLLRKAGFTVLPVFSDSIHKIAI